jgi:putative phosphoribosyl transferase
MFSRHFPYKDRRDAGRQLAAALQFLRPSAPLVLALPRGGVPVAFEVACALHAPLDVLLVRKIGAPLSSEVGIGALVDGDPPLRVMNQRLLDAVQPSAEYLALEERRQLDLIAQRRYAYCGDRKRMSVHGRTVLVVDDGIATGSSMQAALRGLTQEQPAQLLFAVPVGPPEVIVELQAQADDGICLLMPDDFRAVSLYFQNFEQTSDDEVIALLRTPTTSAASQTNQQENMMSTTISAIMTRGLSVIAPDDNLQRAAQLMRDWNIGALPVCEGKKLQGMITDRDITIRASAAGRAPAECKVSEVMTPQVHWCFEDQTVGEVLQEMGGAQVRRIPVMSRNMELVGIVSLGDVATHGTRVDSALEDISAPSQPIRPSADEARLRRTPSNQPGSRF